MKRFLVAITLILLAAAPSWGATYYFSQSGNDSTGTGSAATPWKTVTKMTGLSLSAGDSVLFKCGDTWNLRTEWKQLLVKNSGSAGSVITVGAYYLDGGANPIVGVSGNKPIFDGNLGFPSGLYSGLVGIENGSDYVIFQDLDIRNSYGMSMRFDNASNVSVLRCKLAWAVDMGILFENSPNGLISDCDISNFAREKFGRDGIQGTADDSVTIAQAGGTNFHTSSNGCTIRNTVVHEGYGEGIHVSIGSDNCVVENNIIYDTVLGIFLWGGPANTTIRYNTIYWTNNSAFWFTWVSGVGWRPGAGIYLDDEYYWSDWGMSNITVYGNLVHARIPLWIWSTHVGTTLDSILVYNNTFVQATASNDSMINVGLRNNATPSACNTITNSEIKNNIFYCPSGTCQARLVSDGCSFSGLTFDYNFWTEGLSATSGTSGAHDVVSATAPIAKTTGWATLSPNSLVGSEFGPASAVVDVGVDIGDDYDALLGLTGTDLSTRTFAYLDQDDEGDGWDIGAIIEQGDADPEPPAGTGMPTDGLVAAWKLSGGTWTDSSANGITLSATGTVGQTAGFGGTSNTAAVVAAEGHGNRLVAQDSATLSITGDMSLCFRWKVTATATNDDVYNIVSKDVDVDTSTWGHSYDCIYSTYGAADQIQCGASVSTGYFNGARASYTFSSAPVNNQWYYVCFDNDVGTGSAISHIYVDGVSGTNGSSTGATADSVGDFALFGNIGYMSSKQAIDDVVLYNRVLSSSERAQIENLVDDFAEEETDPIPNIYVNSFGPGGFVLTPATDGGSRTVDINATISGATPAECGIGTGGTGGSFTDVTSTSCAVGSNAYTVTISTPGSYTYTFRTKAEGGSYVYSTLSQAIRLMYSATPGTWTIASSGADSTGTISDCGGSTGFQAGDTIEFGTGATGVDLSACTAQGSVRFSGDLSGTITGGGQSVLAWPTWTGPSTLVGLTGVSGVPLIIRAGDFPAEANNTFPLTFPVTF